MSGNDGDHRRRASAVDKYASSVRGEAPGAPQAAELDDEQVGTFYGRERAVRGPSLSLTLRLKNSTCKTLEYAHRTEIDFDPEVGIEAYYSTGVKVTIKGKHLRQLFEDLARHAVVWIESRDALHAQQEAVGVTGKPLPIVTDIIIERGRLDVDSGIWQPAPGTWNTEQQTWVPRPALLN